MLLSIDPSIVNCGYAVLDGLKVITSGVIKPDPKKHMALRLLELQTEINMIMGHKDYRISHAVVEVKSSFSYKRSTSTRSGKGMNQAALHINSYAIGAILATIANWGIVPEMIEATAWKGGRSKKLDQIIAKQYLGGRIATTDEADSVVLGTYWLQLHPELTKNKQEKEKLENGDNRKTEECPW